MRPPLDLVWENKLFTQGCEMVIGCDESGRGALAGPIVGAAVAFEATFNIADGELSAVQDSKLLSGRQRKKLACLIQQQMFAWSVAKISEKIIDKINIHQANLLVLSEAVRQLHRQLKQLNCTDTHTLIDGKFILPDYPGKQSAIINGDEKIFSIAAASILAKVYRDELMMQLAREFPAYGFEKHKGYGTLFHREQIRKLGLSHVHRQSFRVRI